MVSGTGRDYFVASAADKIYLDPAGGLRLVGMAGQSFYFRGAFDMVGVTPQFEKIGEYKSAPEMFTETGPTPIAARMHDELFDSLWEHWLTRVAEGRKLSKDEVKALVDSGPFSAGNLARAPFFAVCVCVCVCARARTRGIAGGVRAGVDERLQLVLRELAALGDLGEPLVPHAVEQLVRASSRRSRVGPVFVNCSGALLYSAIFSNCGSTPS